MKKYIITIIVVVAIGIAGYAFKDRLVKQYFEPNLQMSNTSSKQPENHIPATPEVVAQNLNVPWEIAFLPDGDMLVTERRGTIQRIGKTNITFTISGVKASGESGLLGLALHPNFRDNQLIYIYTTITNGTNEVQRYQLKDNSLADRRVIIAGIPGASNHDGGRIAFGPDGKLYVTTGDAQVDSRAQDINSLAGKILRINEDGSIPQDNPFNNAVYSYGHRNPQGLAWDTSGRLWATEHGRSGAKSGFDELNLIEKGINYGWPNVEGDTNQPGMRGPIAHSGATTTWAPAGIAITNNTIYFAGLRGQSIFKTNITGDTVEKIVPMFTQTYGRLRAVTVHEKYLYFTTSNKDGRGTTKNGDDQIFRLRLAE